MSTKELREEEVLYAFFNITLHMSFVFLLLFELQWLPFIGKLQAISKPGSSCEREEDLINGGVSSCLDGQRI